MTQKTDSNDSQRTELRELVAELKRRIKGDLTQKVIAELLKERVFPVSVRETASQPQV